ncbi:LemA family protein [Actimicrobium sp. CCI2.3]|uniref:LemA family protein n=1 Tax=Actimicrobium sp. CCI2.3 TaxID=3048616 RepID=UPI002AB56792|nr:LemA family protein [Actimicrobium sp. CCI2.3]MDY7576441.1 LemA family protein [Actimicrobium sp. CCI2.3]MEB0021580.1 LemA family protein [Actimicrobium sp. CCI2.3]
MTAFLVLSGVMLLVLFWAVGAYNRLVSLRNQSSNAFSQIDVQLKRRYDLIPNLVETTKAYMKHESQTLEAVILARNQAVAANAQAVADPASAIAMQQMASAEGALGTSLGKLFALSEAYPDLKANENMMQLTEELTSTENRIAFSRQAFNDAVMHFNTALEQFPGSLVATMGAFKRGELLQATESPVERKVVKVAF